MLVFCHCPKTAGTSLFRAISAVHGPNHSYLAKRERPEIATLRARGITFVGGHVPYGRYAGQDGAAGRDGLQFVTFVRDPIQLTFSLYQHCAQHRHAWRAAAQFFDIELPSRGLARNSPQAVRSFLSRCTAFTGLRWDDFQVRFAVDKPAGALQATDLDVAIRNLAAMEVVGITERFDDSLRLLAMRFGWPSVQYSRYGAQETAPFDDADLAHDIETRCAMDRALVAWAKDRFRTDLAAADASYAARGIPAPTVSVAAAPRRLGLAWARAWLASAATWTRDDWRWWFEVKSAPLRNRLWLRWQSIPPLRGFRVELRIVLTTLADWRSGFVAKVCVIGGMALPFMPFDLIPNRIPVLGHLDDAGYVLGGLLLSRLFVPAEAPSIPAGSHAPDHGLDGHTGASKRAGGDIS
jgi:uncharacterized membrane protein YkvA (DUF1232 family)